MKGNLPMMSKKKMTEEDIVKIILKESNILEDVLNEDLLIKFGKLHNIPPEQNLFKLKQELIARKSYFLNVKKKYALHIINNEGVTVDDLYIKGLVTQRSDYPSMTREKIKEILLLLVKEKDYKFKDIANLIEDTRKKFVQLCIKGDPSIARPVSFNKHLHEYKRVPPQVLGMFFWNKTMYNYFVKGTRGYLFKIFGIDYTKAPDKVKKLKGELEDIDCVVLPYEEERLPDFFVINVDAMMNFCWEDRVDELLEPIRSSIDLRYKGSEISLF